MHFVLGPAGLTMVSKVEEAALPGPFCSTGPAGCEEAQQAIVDVVDLVVVVRESGVSGGQYVSVEFRQVVARSEYWMQRKSARQEVETNLWSG